ncbi:MAG: hypothetical protein NVSMB64_00860 [Candidatus Velthaea sp.]
MKRRIVLAALAVFVFSPLVVRAAGLPPQPSADEAKIVAAMSADLQKRFATANDAEKAGYVRYTNEDETGAISYANTHPVSADIKDPSQLWYGVNGKLLGADYATAQAGQDTPPAMFGFAASRAHKLGAHVHYVLKNADGTYTYGKAVGAKAYAAAGLDPLKADAAGIVKVGAAKSTGEVAAVISFPNLWDVTVWAVPNPDGAFADANPSVKPSAGAKAGH